MGSALGLKYEFFGLTTIRRVSLAEHLACSTAESSRIHVSVHGKFLLLVLDFKRNWNKLRDFSHDPNIILLEHALRISRVAT
jgi:hypothetical protein